MDYVRWDSAPEDGMHHGFYYRYYLDQPEQRLPARAIKMIVQEGSPIRQQQFQRQMGDQPVENNFQEIDSNSIEFRDLRDAVQQAQESDQ